MTYKNIYEVFIAHHKCFPNSNAKGYKLLVLFAQKRRITREELTRVLGDSFRTDIQALDGEVNNCWLIHRGNINNKMLYIELDERHYSKDINIDNKARLERRKKLTEQSYKEAKLGSAREEAARVKRSDARAAHFLSLGEAANDPNVKNKKPSMD
ncbi:hypothetical protein [Colwellia piezophila]|uniref:hypothetical protein n=1 Tax=Colwellia piezophila TaxID=211668 RepID=UPI00036A5CA5|nr:hypothetical protein [Colwellia piezophila]